MRLTSAKSSIVRRREAESSFESFGEMTLIGETCGDGDFAQPGPGGDELFGHKVQTKTPDILSDGASVLSAEYASQMNRMDAGARGHIITAK